MEELAGANMITWWKNWRSILRKLLVELLLHCVPDEEG
jgi:hypothetical protein